MKSKEIFVAPGDFKFMPDEEAAKILEAGNDIILNAKVKSRYGMMITTSLENARSYPEGVIRYLEEHPDLAIYIPGFKKPQCS